MSLPEVLLWNALKRRQLRGLQFRKQHPVGPYILDFYCDAVRLAPPAARGKVLCSFCFTTAEPPARVEQGRRLQPRTPTSRSVPLDAPRLRA
jgi:hypothetical protein